MPAYYTNSKLKKKIAPSVFRLNVIRALVEEFGAQKSDSRGRLSIETHVRITARHIFHQRWKAQVMGEGVALPVVTQLVAQSTKQKSATNAKSAMLAYV